MTQPTTPILTRRTLTALAFAATLAGPALAQEPPGLKGVIIAHEGPLMVLRTTGGEERRVRLQDSTKVEGVVGTLGVRRENRLPNELIPGLPIEVSGNLEGDELVADLVTFKPGDLKTARQIQAGLYGTEQRLASVGELAAVDRTKVYFAKNSSTLSAKGKQDLLALANKAKDYKGYRLAVVGRADTSGSSAANQNLSEARAASVTAFLLQSGGVLPGSILPPTAVGDAPIFQDPDAPTSAQDARRVTVTLAVSKASLPHSASPH
jgi:outer membrane protein OmpA-like peptidoglycan-associated protein